MSTQYCLDRWLNVKDPVTTVITHLSSSYPLVEEFLDEGFPEMLLDSFGLQHQTIVQLTQLLYEAVGTWRWSEVFTAEVLW